MTPVRSFSIDDDSDDVGVEVNVSPSTESPPRPMATAVDEGNLDELPGDGDIDVDVDVDVTNASDDRIHLTAAIDSTSGYIPLQTRLYEVVVPPSWRSVPFIPLLIGAALVALFVLNVLVIVLSHDGVAETLFAIISLVVLGISALFLIVMTIPESLYPPTLPQLPAEVRRVVSSIGYTALVPLTLYTIIAVAIASAKDDSASVLGTFTFALTHAAILTFILYSAFTAALNRALQVQTVTITNPTYQPWLSAVCTLLFLSLINGFSLIRGISGHRDTCGSLADLHIFYTAVFSAAAVLTAAFIVGESIMSISKIIEQRITVFIITGAVSFAILWTLGFIISSILSIVFVLLKRDCAGMYVVSVIDAVCIWLTVGILIAKAATHLNEFLSFVTQKIDAEPLSASTAVTHTGDCNRSSLR